MSSALLYLLFFFRSLYRIPDNFRSLFLVADNEFDEPYGKTVSCTTLGLPFNCGDESPN